MKVLIVISFLLIGNVCFGQKDIFGQYLYSSTNSDFKIYEADYVNDSLAFFYAKYRPWTKMRHKAFMAKLNKEGGWKFEELQGKVGRTMLDIYKCNYAILDSIPYRVYKKNGIVRIDKLVENKFKPIKSATPLIMHEGAIVKVHGKSGMLQVIVQAYNKTNLSVRNIDIRTMEIVSSYDIENSDMSGSLGWFYDIDNYDIEVIEGFIVRNHFDKIILCYKDTNQRNLTVHVIEGDKNYRSTFLFDTINPEYFSEIDIVSVDSNIIYLNQMGYQFESGIQSITHVLDLRKVEDTLQLVDYRHTLSSRLPKEYNPEYKMPISAMRIGLELIYKSVSKNGECFYFYAEAFHSSTFNSGSSGGANYYLYGDIIIVKKINETTVWHQRIRRGLVDKNLVVPIVKDKSDHITIMYSDQKRFYEKNGAYIAYDVIKNGIVIGRYDIKINLNKETGDFTRTLVD